jgi:putative SOS response-associated peptidase YedK
MCYHKAQTKNVDDLSLYYNAKIDREALQAYQPRYHENGFDFLATPIVTAHRPGELRLYSWGLIPYWVKDLANGVKLRTQTLNCISEEMFEKSSFKDAAKNGQRCLIPCTGFYEWRWMDEKGKMKIPFHIRLTNQELFSLAGLYSKWMDKESGQAFYTYTVLTTSANPLMETIHNSRKRMPVIIPREYERDWLNPTLRRKTSKHFASRITTTRWLHIRYRSSLQRKVQILMFQRCYK